MLKLIPLKSMGYKPVFFYTTRENPGYPCMKQKNRHPCMKLQISYKKRSKKIRVRMILICIYPRWEWFSFAFRLGSAAKLILRRSKSFNFCLHMTSNNFFYRVRERLWRSKFEKYCRNYVLTAIWHYLRVKKNPYKGVLLSILITLMDHTLK